jgi:hypothetical protein
MTYAELLALLADADPQSAVFLADRRSGDVFEVTFAMQSDESPEVFIYSDAWEAV